MSALYLAVNEATRIRERWVKALLVVWGPFAHYRRAMVKEFSRRKMDKVLNSPNVTAHRLTDNGLIPNNPRLPLLIYHNAIRLRDDDPASAVERILAGNKWGASWRNGIYPYHHYHSTAHEVLVVTRGSARVQLGGEKGITQKIHPGDVILIPAGVGHKNLGASNDLEIVGAYPKGQDWDMNCGKRTERPRADQNIARVRLPETDPIYGADGPLLDYWRS